MNGSVKCVTDTRNKRAHTTFAIAPVTLAIRSALALSAAMLMVPSPVLATANAPESLSVYARKHDSAQPRSEPDLTPSFDLTRVADERIPTSVTLVDWLAGIAADPLGDSAVADGHLAVSFDNGAAGSFDDLTLVGGDIGFASAPVDNNTAVDHNGSSIAVSGYGFAYGLYVFNDYSASVTNSTDVSVLASAGVLDATAYGAIILSNHFASLTNDTAGAIDASAITQDGNALAVGAYVSGHDVTTLLNYGDISAKSVSQNGNAAAYAAVVAGASGISLLINGGDLSAEALAGAGRDAYAAGAYVQRSVASIFNDGNISATATAVGGTATAKGARAYGEFVSMSNYGDLSASAGADGGTAVAIGSDSLGYSGASFYNAGNVGAVAVANGGQASAIGASSLGGLGAYSTNVGSISAMASGDVASASGIVNMSSYGVADTTNAGNISAVAEGGVAPYGVKEAVAFGVYNFALLYDSVVDNSGSISAAATATTDITGTNGFLVANAIGVAALNPQGYGQATIANTGSIGASAVTSQGYAGAWGAISQSGQYGASTIDNAGAISSYAHTNIGSANATGAVAYTVAGTSSIVNHGDISATADGERGIVNVTVNFAVATGVQATSLPYGAGKATVDNFGSIQAHTRVYGGIGYSYGVQASGLYTSVNNAAGASITAITEAELFGGAFATGVQVSGVYNVGVVNDGSITAYGHANAYSDGIYGFYGSGGAVGIDAKAGAQGDVMVVNNGDVTAVAIGEHSVNWSQGGAGATGITTYAHDATIVNSGAVTAIANSQFGIVGANGVIAQAKYSSNIVNAAGAHIVAYASVGSLDGDQYAGRAFSWGTQTFGSGMDHAVTYNAGNIVSHAVVTPDGGANAGHSIATAFGSSIGYAPASRTQSWSTWAASRPPPAPISATRRHTEPSWPPNMPPTPPMPAHPCECRRRRRQRLRGRQLRDWAAPDLCYPMRCQRLRLRQCLLCHGRRRFDTRQQRRHRRHGKRQRRHRLQLRLDSARRCLGRHHQRRTHHRSHRCR